MSEAYMISVIVATKNRSEAIAACALPSLARQDETGFEVLIWDASDDESTKEIADSQKFLFETRGIDLIYQKAGRSGLTSQRNDAVLAARGDVILFLDDDCEPSSDAVRVVRKYFDDFTWLKGMGLPLINKFHRNTSRKHGTRVFLKDIFYRIFFGPSGNKRVIRPSTNYMLPEMDVPGPAELLSGGSMAFRKDVFREIQFEERLQRFGGYAYGEDVDFSYRVFLRFGEPFIIASAGHVIHRGSPGGRIKSDSAKFSAMYYNTRIIRDNFKEYGKYGLISFLWEQRIGRSIAMLAGGYRLMDMIRGYIEYRKALREDNPKARVRR